jgi:acyl-CoA hydrolase/GNAT superfamily N-acetyltransferase
MGNSWKKLVVPVKHALKPIKPGMSIFLGSGLAEPKTLLNALMRSDHSNTKDLELIQLNSHSDILSLKNLNLNKYRLKTFFGGWVASEAVEAGSIDLIPARQSQIPRIFASPQVSIDAVFIQISPPNSSGYCSLGIAVDVAREAMEKASVVIGEIQPELPFTLGDTLVSIKEFDSLVEADQPLVYSNRPPVSDIMGKVAGNIASTISNGDCISFHTGTSLFEALCGELAGKRNLGIHTPYFTDALMDLMKTGAVSNYKKSAFRGKSITSYALGTQDLITWLNLNPLVEFQSIAELCNPALIATIANFNAVFHAKKVDLFGRITFHIGKGSLTSGPGIAADIITGAEMSRGGRTIFGLPSRDTDGNSNVVGLLANQQNQFHMRESISTVATEYGVANLKWRSIREKAQALIEIAHPDDRKDLVALAKGHKIVFQDQIFVSSDETAHPMETMAEHIFKNNLKISFRLIRPSDEEAMRRLFYRFSDETIYRRFFYPLTTMPHDKMQEYVNIDHNQTVSIVAIAGEIEQENIVAEARFECDDTIGFGDMGIVVDERFHNQGIGSCLYAMLVKMAQERGLQGLKAQVLQENKNVMGMLHKGGFPIKSKLADGVYSIEIPFKGNA